MPFESAAANLLLASIAATAASTAIAARTAQQQGKTTSAIAQQNAEISRTQAAEEAKRLRIAGTEEQRQRLEERRRILARNRAKFGKAGVVMEGSPLLVQQEVAKNLTLDAAMANYNIQIGVKAALTRGESEAQLSLLKGRTARAAGRLQAGQALFSGAAQIVSTGLQTELAKNA